MQTIDDSKMCLVKLPNCANCAQNKFFFKAVVAHGYFRFEIVAWCMKSTNDQLICTIVLCVRRVALEFYKHFVLTLP